MSVYREHEPDGELYLATNSQVLCLDQRTGERRWQTALPASAVGSPVVSLLTHDALLFAGASRLVAALDRAEGHLVWDTRIRRLRAPVAMTLSHRTPGGLLVVAGAGLVAGLQADTGAVMWQNDLAGLGWQPVSLRVPGGVSTRPVDRNRSGK